VPRAELRIAGIEPAREPAPQEVGAAFLADEAEDEQKEGRMSIGRFVHTLRTRCAAAITPGEARGLIARHCGIQAKEGSAKNIREYYRTPIVYREALKSILQAAKDVQRVREERVARGDADPDEARRGDARGRGDGRERKSRMGVNAVIACGKIRRLVRAQIDTLPKPD